MGGRTPKRHDCGELGMLTAKEIAERAGIAVTVVYQRISCGLRGAALCRKHDPKASRRSAAKGYRENLFIDPGETGVMFVAIRVSKAYPHRAPTAKELMTRFGMTKATAYRWRRAWLDASGASA